MFESSRYTIEQEGNMPQGPENAFLSFKIEQEKEEKGSLPLNRGVDEKPPCWSLRLSTLVNNLHLHLCLPQVEQMILDAEATTEEKKMAQTYNCFLVTTRTGNCLLAKNRIMLCLVNPFSIASMLIAAKMLRLREVSGQNPCPVKEELITWSLSGHLPYEYYFSPYNKLLMQLAVEKFVLAITGGLKYGQTMALELWPKSP